MYHQTTQGTNLCVLYKGLITQFIASRKKVIAKNHSQGTRAF